MNKQKQQLALSRIWFSFERTREGRSWANLEHVTTIEIFDLRALQFELDSSKSNLWTRSFTENWNLSRQGHGFHETARAQNRRLMTRVADRIVPGSPRGLRKIDAFRILELRKLHRGNAEIDVARMPEAHWLSCKHPNNANSRVETGYRFKYWLAISLTGNECNWSQLNIYSSNQLVVGMLGISSSLSHRQKNPSDILGTTSYHRGLLGKSSKLGEYRFGLPDDEPINLNRPTSFIKEKLFLFRRDINRYTEAYLSVVWKRRARRGWTTGSCGSPETASSLATPWTVDHSKISSLAGHPLGLLALFTHTRLKSICLSLSFSVCLSVRPPGVHLDHDGYDLGTTTWYRRGAVRRTQGHPDERPSGTVSRCRSGTLFSTFRAV